MKVKRKCIPYLQEVHRLEGDNTVSYCDFKHDEMPWVPSTGGLGRGLALSGTHGKRVSKADINP